MPRKKGSEDPNIKICLTCKGDGEVRVYEGRKIVGMKKCPACHGKGGQNLGTV